MPELSPLFPQEEKVIQLNQRTDPFFYRFSLASRGSTDNQHFQHFHLFYEVFICGDGITEHYIGSKRYMAQPYDIVLIPPSALHKALFDSQGTYSRLVVQFSPGNQEWALGTEYANLLTLFQEDPPVFRFPRSLLSQILHPLNEIFTQTLSPESERLFIHAKFTEFLCILYANRDKNTFLTLDSNLDKEKTSEFRNYILRHSAEAISLSSVADHFHISPCYLSHLFRSATGYTLTDYIQITRIQNALSLLVFTKKKMGEIASECGFNSISQFNRVFLKHMDMSPSEYRVHAKESKTEFIPQVGQKDPPKEKPTYV